MLCLLQCGAVREILTTHHYRLTWDGTIRAALTEGGCDTSCGTGYPQHMLDAYEHGAVSLADLQARGALGTAAVAAVMRASCAPPPQAAASNLMRQVFDVGLMDPPERIPYSSYGPERVDTPLHRQLAYEAALQGIVLLQARQWGRMGGEASLHAAPRRVQDSALALLRSPCSRLRRPALRLTEQRVRGVAQRACDAAAPAATRATRGAARRSRRPQRSRDADPLVELPRLEHARGQPERAGGAAARGQRGRLCGGLRPGLHRRP